MKNLKDFKGFILESYSAAEREDIFIDSPSEDEVFEAKKRFSQEELAKEARKSLEEGETVYIKIMGNPNRPVKTITQNFGKLLNDMVDSIAYGEFRRRWTTLSEEQFEEIKFRALKYILMDWDKSVDKPNLTDGQIYGNLRTLIKSRIMAAHRQYMGEIVKEPKLVGEEPDALDRTISKIANQPSSMFRSDSSQEVPLDIDLKRQVGDEILSDIQEIPLLVRKEIFKCLSRNPRCTYDQIKQTLSTKGMENYLQLEEFMALKKIFQMTKA